MPELPEVEIVKQALEKALVSHVIKDVDQRREGLRVPFPDDLPNNLKGRRIERIKRRAKYILIDLDDGMVLVVHLGMSGKVLIIESGKDYKIQKHDHLIMSFDDGSRFVLNDTRRFGMVLLIPQDKLGEHPSFKNLGPEPLDNSFSGPVLANALENKKCNIKTALLDQRVVSGLGNIYVCESLFDTGISPETRACDISNSQVENLVVAIRDVLTRSLAAGGSSLKDYRHTDGDIGYFQQQLAVYGREGEACSGCSCDVSKTGGVKRIAQAGRSTFFCPRKQKVNKQAGGQNYGTDDS